MADSQRVRDIFTPQRPKVESRPTELVLRALSKEQREFLQFEVMQHINNIDVLMQALRDDWRKYINQYKVMVKNPDKKFPWPGCANIFVPELLNQITTITAFIMSSEFSMQGPTLRVKPYKKEDTELMAEFELWLDFYQRQVQRMPAYWRRHLPYLLLLGTHICKSIYRADTVTGWPLSKPTGIPLLQFYTYPTVLELASSPFVGDAQYYSVWEMLAIAKEHPRIYDETLLKETLEKVDEYWTQHSVFGPPQGTDPLYRIPPNHLAVMDGYMLTSFGKLETPSKLHFQFEMMTGQLLMIEEQADQALPYNTVFWRRREDNFFGTGIGEVCHRLQDGLNTVYNQGIDNGTVVNTKVFARARGSGLDNAIKIYPGAMVDVNNRGDLEPLNMGDVNPSIWMLIRELKQAMQAATAAPESFQGLPDTVAKSGVSPGVISQNVGQAGMRLEFFMGEFEEGLVDLTWDNLVMLAKYAAKQPYPISSLQRSQTLREWIEDMDSEQIKPADIDQLLAARVEPEAVAGIQEKVFSLERITIARTRFELRPMRRELNKQMEQQASMLLSQMVNAYIAKITEFAQQLVMLKQQGAPQEIISALFAAWNATTAVMRRTLAAFAVEDVAEILVKIEQVINGLQSGVDRVGAVALGSPESPTEQSGFDLGTGPQGGAGAAAGIQGGRPANGTAAPGTEAGAGAGSAALLLSGLKE